MRDLVAKVKEVGADVGIAFDGDGDRIGIVDERGEIVPPDRYLLLFVRQVLRGSPAKVVFEVRCSEALFDGVTKYVDAKRGLAESYFERIRSISEIKRLLGG